VALWIVLRAFSRRLGSTAAVEALVPEGIPTERTIALWAVVCLVVLLPVGLAVLQGLQSR